MTDKSILQRLEEHGQPAPRVQLKGSEGGAASSDRYEVRGEIARGGVGIVYRGRDTDLGRDVALKVLRADHLENVELLERFVEEAQIGGQLQHPGIVPVYELGLRSDRCPYFAMKLVKGETLAKRLAGRQSPAEGRHELLAVFRDACRTVAYAHSRGVIHRDLKPSNVMIGSFGEVQVVDWGFAKVLRRGGIDDEKLVRKAVRDRTMISTIRSKDGSDTSLAGSVMGTPAYMPPEQALGRVDDLDERSDLFSLGAILCEILTGSAPYTGSETDRITAAAHARLDDARQRLASCGASEDLVALCRRCLEPLPKDRPTSAEVLAETIARYLARAETRSHRAQVRAVEAQARAEAQTRVQRRLLLRLGSVAVVVLVSLAAYLFVDGRRRAREDGRRQAIQAALQDAARLRSAEQWSDARAAAERAMALGSDGALASTIHREAQAAEAAAAQQAAEQALLGELEAVRVARLESQGSTKSAYRQLDVFVGVVESDARYRAVFARHGLELEAAEGAPSAAARLRAAFPGIAVELAAVFDEWAFLQASQEGAQGTPAAFLGQVAGVLDPDPVRRMLRDALGAGDGPALQQLARSMRPETVDPRTLDLVGLGLQIGGHLDEAIRWFEDAVRLHPQDVLLRFHLATGFAMLVPPRWDAAVRHLTVCLALRPDAPKLRRLLAGNLDQVGRLPEATVVLEAAHERWPADLDLMADQREALSRVGRHDEAIALARRLVELEPALASHQNGLGMVYGRAGRTDEALQAFEAAMRLAPGERLFAVNRVVSLWVSRRVSPEEALALVRPLQSDCAYAYSLEATILSESGRLEEALVPLRTAVGLLPDDPEPPRQLVKLLQDLGRHAEAVEIAQSALRRRPDDGSIIHNLAVCLQALGRQEEAFEVVDRAIGRRPHDASFFLALGDLHRTSGALTKAAEAYRKATLLDPGEATARTRLGFCLAELGDPDGAEAAFREALRLDRTQLEAWANLSVVLRDRQQWQEAVACARQRVVLRPGSAQARVVLASCLHGAGQRDEAIAAAEEAVRLGPHEADGYQALGIALQASGRLKEALEALQEALRLDPSNANAHDGLGIVLQGLGRHEEAIAAHREAIRLEPSEANAHGNLANALSTRGLLEEAHAVLQVALRLEPARAMSHALLADVLSRLGRHEEALRAGHEAVRLDPRLPQAQGNLAFALFRMGRTEEAEAPARESLRLAPTENAYVLLAQVLQKQGRGDDAEAALREGLRVFPQGAELHRQLGVLLDALGRSEEALARVREAIRLDPGAAMAYVTLGTVLQRHGKPADALEAYVEATRVDPSNGDCRAVLGIFFLESDRYEQALPWLREAIALGISVPAVELGARVQLGWALLQLGRLDESIEASREAIRRATTLLEAQAEARVADDAQTAYTNLLAALHQRGGWKDVIGGFVALARLLPHEAGPHAYRGAALLQVGRPAQAVEAFREALRLDPTHAASHMQLWYALLACHRGEEALAAAQEALVHHPDAWWARGNVANALVGLGRFAEALAAAKEVEARAAETPLDQQMALVQWLGPFLREVEASTRTEGRLDGVLAGTEAPDDVDERLRVATFLLMLRRQDLRAAREFVALLDEEPGLVREALTQARYNAACAAARLGTGRGRGEGADSLTEEERASWRERALEWIRAALQAQRGSPVAVQTGVASWPFEPDLEGVRDEEALAALPDEERAAWRALWKDVEAAIESLSGP